MDFFEVVSSRYSARSFTKKDVEKDKLDKILEAANLSPSAGNLQSYEIVVVKKKKEQLADAYRPWILEAPIILVILTNEKISEKYGERGKNLYTINDASIAAAYIQLAATALGLGSCWVGAFDQRKVAEIVGAPDYMKPIIMLPIGYPNDKPGKKIRRKDITHDEKIEI